MSGSHVARLARDPRTAKAILDTYLAISPARETPTQDKLVLLLAEHPGMTRPRLALALDISYDTANSLVRRAVRSGWVTSVWRSIGNGVGRHQVRGYYLTVPQGACTPTVPPGGGSVLPPRARSAPILGESGDLGERNP